MHNIRFIMFDLQSMHEISNYYLFLAQDRKDKRIGHYIDSSGKNTQFHIIKRRILISKNKTGFANPCSGQYIREN